MKMKRKQQQVYIQSTTPPNVRGKRRVGMSIDRSRLDQCRGLISMMLKEEIKGPILIVVLEYEKNTHDANPPPPPQSD